MILITTIFIVIAAAAHADKPCVPLISVTEEAELIALESTNSLLAPPPVVDYIAQSITSIRMAHSCISQVRHTGNHLLGAIKIYNYTSDVYCRLDTCKFGPLKTVIRLADSQAIAVFTRPFNPTVLAKSVAMECGLQTWPAWLETPDYGEILFNPDDHSFTFREGLVNCGPNAQNYWTFVREKNGWVIGNHYQTGIPQEQTTTTTTTTTTLAPATCPGKMCEESS